MSNTSKSQKHLSPANAVNLGSYYTPADIVESAYSIMRKNIRGMRHFTIVDSSCGYGSFLQKPRAAARMIGADIDPQALAEAKKTAARAEIVRQNSLCNVRRAGLNIQPDEKIIAVGNPPYNDTTSIIRHAVKDASLRGAMDADIKTRDTGMAFLLSYNKLQADYVCVLHPLSYLIKKANFARLANFTGNYRLRDGLIISSRQFPDTSRGVAFPILIALYQRTADGMSYPDILSYRFQVQGGGEFRLKDFDAVGNYVAKYPNKSSLREGDAPVAKFWTLRDINALKRNKTFIIEDSDNAVYVRKEHLPYYCYIDIFKRYADKMPYFIGNCDIIIDHEKFRDIQECFVCESVRANPALQNTVKAKKIPGAAGKINAYFRELLKSKFGGKYAENIN